jgi:hypothetical protein
MKKLVLVVLVCVFSPIVPLQAQGWTVAMWYGAVDELNAQWQICDGTNGTPDLRDKFIVGVGVESLGDVGGVMTNTTYHRHQVEQHAHTITSDGNHGHDVTSSTMPVMADLLGNAVLTSISLKTSGAHSHTGSTGNSSPYTSYQGMSLENRPPYMAVYYICYSGTITVTPLAVSAIVTDPLTTDYYTTTTGIVYSRARTVDTGTEITNYLLLVIVCLVALQSLVWFITEAKRKWN